MKKGGRRRSRRRRKEKEHPFTSCGSGAEGIKAQRIFRAKDYHD